ncbi:MAG: hypothetical protein [Circular genetic element sp.]|nr:MAG: hypothetical protein [Circular genetic element sp.]
MARRNNNKLTVAQRNLRYDNKALFPAGTFITDTWLDCAQGLSIVNRKLFSQEHCYSIKNISASFTPSPLYDRVVLQCITAGNTWSVHNAWTKAKALHTEMQDNVLDDMPSIEGKWAEFKVYLDSNQKAAGPYANPTPLDADGVNFLAGEWNHSTFVMPQHDVDPATGLPLVATELTGHLCGPDTADGRGLIKAYAESRATVQPNAPAVPATVEDSFYNLLTDSGSQEPELAAVIIDENDQPPYHETDYPGGGTNGPTGQLMVTEVMNEHMPNLNTGPFLAECGLIHVRAIAYLAGDPVAVPIRVVLNVELEEGHYKGVAATPMGQ